MTKKGSLLIEFVLGAGVFALFVIGLTSLSRLVERRQQSQSAARLGTLLQSQSGVSENTVRAFVAPWPAVIGRFFDAPAAASYKLVHTRINGIDIICEQEDL